MEKSNDAAAQRWWRTLADGLTPERAQASLDDWCARRGDVRVRWHNKIKTSVAGLAAIEPLAALPERPYPALRQVERTVSAQALVAFDGNFYAVPPGHRGQQVRVRHILGADSLEIVTSAGSTLAVHRMEPKGAHVEVRPKELVAALERAVLGATGNARTPCRRKERIPPSPQALAEAEAIRARRDTAALSSGMASVTDFAAYVAAARPLGQGQAGIDDDAVSAWEKGEGQ